MKKFFIVAMLICALVLSVSAQKKTTPAKKSAPAAKTTPSTQSAFKTVDEKISYAVGCNFGMQVLSDTTINPKIFLQGMQDAVTQKGFALSSEELQNALQLFQQKMMEKQQKAQAEQQEQMKKMSEEMEKTKAEGKKFLDSNKTKDSVKVTASGLQYKILKTGTGVSPKDTSTVVVHYRGKLLDGTIFDESYKRGEPATFKLNQVIKGWTEGVQLMNKGAKFEFYIPSDLAYGDRGAGGLIPPGATLIFEVELLDIK